eukprot:1002278-Pyramimonas_sp.AAC.1
MALRNPPPSDDERCGCRNFHSVRAGLGRCFICQAIVQYRYNAQNRQSQTRLRAWVVYLRNKSPSSRQE